MARPLTYFCLLSETWDMAAHFKSQRPDILTSVGRLTAGVASYEYKSNRFYRSLVVVVNSHRSFWLFVYD